MEGFLIFFPDTVFQLSEGGGLKFFEECLQEKNIYKKKSIPSKSIYLSILHEDF